MGVVCVGFIKKVGIVFNEDFDFVGVWSFWWC